MVGSFRFSKLAGNLLVALVAGIALAATGSAATITVESAPNITQALADRQAWFTANFDSESILNDLENFSGVSLGPYFLISDAVGTFSDTGTTPFAIRSAPAGGHELDSNGAKEITLYTTVDSFALFLTDVDPGVTLLTGDGTKYVFPTGISTNNLFFVGIAASSGGLHLLSGTGSWFDLDDVATVTYQENDGVPEPAAWPVVLALGVAILAVRRKLPTTPLRHLPRS